MRGIRWNESNCDRHCNIHESTRDRYPINRCYTHHVWVYIPDFEEIYDL